ncbi:hypothetical protein CTA2_12869 [Colletotrichum tanaceti]|uniref:Uncharacterized protein n=1 Tax=Colletotrichum tanaceti TaxID=1306861 RepID=A0A4U6XLF8_9PEZI|nr:hypothetical protein CTA2_12869 [Colletotrichum tanaceti]TKW56463.1 hypothetical protein CTA1_2106 [Colletotrichum tanaceti]
MERENLTYSTSRFATMPPLSSPDLSHVANPGDSSWCLRCLGFYVGLFKSNDGQACQDINFICKHTGPGTKCERCAGFGRRDRECLTIPKTQQNQAREVIEKRRIMFRLENSLERFVSQAEQNALNRVFREVERATRAHYEDVARQAQQEGDVEPETGRGATISFYEDDSDSRRLLRDVPRKSYVSHLYESGDEDQPDDGDHDSVFGTANQDCFGGAPRVPGVLPVDRAIRELKRLEEAQAAASRRLGEATWLGMKRGSAPGPETLVPPVGRMPGNSNPRNHDQMGIQGAIDQVERANAARELAFQQLGKVVYAMESPAGLAPERDQPESQGGSRSQCGSDA